MSNVPTSLNVPKNPAERRAWICYQLRLRGSSLRRIASDLGVSQQAASHALLSPSSHIEKAIAEAIGLTPETLFPERFDAAGNRLSRVREQQRTTRRRAGNVQSGEAA